MRKHADINQHPLTAGREHQYDYVLSPTYRMAGGQIDAAARLVAAPLISFSPPLTESEQAPTQAPSTQSGRLFPLRSRHFCEPVVSTCDTTAVPHCLSGATRPLMDTWVTTLLSCSAEALVKFSD